MVYVGSKARLAKYIVPILHQYIYQNNIENYIEPFVGGANIIDKIICKNKYGYDLQAGLIEIYKAVQEGWVPFEHITALDYLAAKQGGIVEPLRSYIGFNGSYASKYFGGFARGFKEDKVTLRDIYNERTRNFIEQIPYLKNINFLCEDYRNISVKEHSLIYCDPPYENTTKYSTKSFNHNTFWAWVREISKSNIVIVSEFSAPEDFKSIWEKERVTSLDKNTGGKHNIEHLFIINEGGN